jgi:hypothetical protein
VSEEVVLSREQLYDLVWSKPIQSLAREYGISDVGFAKRCHRYGIPVPPRGYWARVDAGQFPKREPLPDRRDLRDPQIRMMRFDAAETGQAQQPKPIDIAAKKLRERVESYVVPESLPADAHPLVRKARQLLEKANIDNEGLYELPKTPCLDIRAGPLTVDRALRIWNALLLLFEQSDFNVDVTTATPSTTIVTVNDERLSVALFEEVAKKARDPVETKRPAPRTYLLNVPRIEYDYVPTGKLCIHINETELDYYISGRRNFSDRGATGAEQCLGAVLSGLVRLAEAQKLARQRRADEERERKKQEKETAARQAYYYDWCRRRDEESKRANALVAASDAWHAAERIRRYVGEIVRLREANGASNEPSNDAGKWIAWALEQADRLDPLRPNPKSILCEEEPPRY